MVSVIAIGDPHFMTKNIPEVELFIEKSLELIESRSPDFIVVLGDLLHEHERIHTITLNKAYGYIDRLRMLAKTFILIGNHDMINNQQFLNDNHWMNGMKEWDNVTVVDVVKSYEIKGKTFYFCPYVPPGRFVEALNTSGEGWKECDCIFAHQEFYGCKMGAIESVEGDKWSLEHPNVISGHIHSNQTIQKNVYYPGAAMQHAFGESHKNVIPCMKFEGEMYELEEIDLKLPRKKILYVDVEELEDYEIKDGKDKIRLTVSGTYEQFKVFKKSKKYKNLVDKGIKIVYKDKRVAKNDIKIESNDFYDIIKKLVYEERNGYLLSDFNYVIENKKKDDEILII
jgi:DNA repair exonuclease SbcCD nuclease subunit